MKIVHISDIHSNENENFLKYLDENEIDLVLISGDITDFGPKEFADDFLNKIASKTSVIAIHGNCDIESVYNTIENSKATFAHNKINLFKNILICGFGGSNPTPFNTPFEINEEDLYTCLNNLIDYENVVLKENKLLNKDKIIKILLTHAPPFETEADKISNGDHVGSKAIRDVLNENDFDLNLCGHIHEAKSISKLNNTIIANPGMFKDNHGILITTNNDSSDFNIEIIEF
ncbi:MAG: metallophosphoesterase [Methanobrevibacter sp.]|jgi:Icc-related predicted phosphoesterase|nr:metallophosphoesterase [Candidatus Methanovirga basalitermitum]